MLYLTTLIGSQSSLSSLITVTQTIESDKSLSELEKAKRQQLMSRSVLSFEGANANSNKGRINSHNDIVNFLDGIPDDIGLKGDIMRKTYNTRYSPSWSYEDV